tara:strand:+ start:533 stop:739 length:207 start_codon:yes stop_codon:yes gene_type:complete
MELNKRLEVIQEQYDNMIKYRALCNGMNCTINYSSQDFERELMLGKKIIETKNWINEKETNRNPQRTI